MNYTRKELTKEFDKIRTFIDRWEDADDRNTADEMIAILADHIDDDYIEMETKQTEDEESVSALKEDLKDLQTELEDIKDTLDMADIKIDDLQIQKSALEEEIEQCRNENYHAGLEKDLL